MSIPAAWPRNGFETLIDYVSSFLHLNINLGTSQSCKLYHDRWLDRYSRHVNTWTNYDIALWSLRCRQSLKLSFSATYFALSAQEAETLHFKAAEYFYAYYGMLHAMWAVVYLHPDQSIDHLTSITHSKIANLYHAEFASGTTPIIVENVKELAEDLRYLREYYSYRMPLNSPFTGTDDFSVSYARLGGFVKQSIQLANLHSHFLRKLGERKGKCAAKLVGVEALRFRKYFDDVNGKRHPSRPSTSLDDADKHALHEALTGGCDLLPLSIAYDHMYNNFMTWDEDKPGKDILQRVRGLVWGAMF